VRLPLHRLVFDPNLLGGPFAAPTFAAHRALVAGTWGGPMSVAERALWDQMAGGRAPLAKPPSLIVIVKSRRIAMTQLIGGGIAPALALNDWPHQPGEAPQFLYLASDRQQAGIAFGRADGALHASPLPAAEVVNVTADRIELRNGNVLRVGTADNAAVRGVTLIGAAIDEACYVSGLPELLAALRPALATTGGPLILFSTPRGAHGPVYDLFRKHFGGSDPDVLVIRAHVRDFNPTISEAFIQRELELDPYLAPAEWLCEFISGLASFVDAELVDGATRSEPRELPPLSMLPSGGHVRYVAGLDVSGGRSDAAACAVAHRDGQRVIVDACRRWPAPHDPAAVAREVAALLAPYGLRSAVADHYGAELSRALYSEAELALAAADVTRSESYLRLLPMLTTGRVELPPDPTLRLELLGLERRTGRSGRDSVDHRPGSHDDLANALALAAWAASRRPSNAQRMVHAECSTMLDGLHGPVVHERMHPTDRRIDDPVAIHLQHERDLF
jgi:hypothetical protein